MDIGVATRSDSAPPAARKRWVPRSLVLGSTLFALGLISLFTGHVASEIEWSQLRKAWRSRKVLNPTYLRFLVVTSSAGGEKKPERQNNETLDRKLQNRPPVKARAEQIA
ncbi:hypothetical protein J5N97_029772 [Dioscorea zingiberensis]|uniref:Uncharacterized protein n=1 Tax=Dioscorea zingiberensis TaxID=325984 RepID=A0A9D5BW52_9LILI|nr:hypothetical protein J5N97_029772 [Dioscorea zingiberensis]